MEQTKKSQKNQAHLSTRTVSSNWSSLATKKQNAPADMSRILLGLHDGDSLFLLFDLLLKWLKLDVNLKADYSSLLRCHRRLSKRMERKATRSKNVSISLNRG